MEAPDSPPGSVAGSTAATGKPTPEPLTAATLSSVAAVTPEGSSLAADLRLGGTAATATPIGAPAEAAAAASACARSAAPAAAAADRLDACHGRHDPGHEQDRHPHGALAPLAAPKGSRTGPGPERGARVGASPDQHVVFLARTRGVALQHRGVAAFTAVAELLAENVLILERMRVRTDPRAREVLEFFFPETIGKAIKLW